MWTLLLLACLALACFLMFTAMPTRLRRLAMIAGVIFLQQGGVVAAPVPVGCGIGSQTLFVGNRGLVGGFGNTTLIQGRGLGGRQLFFNQSGLGGNTTLIQGRRGLLGGRSVFFNQNGVGGQTLFVR